MFGHLLCYPISTLITNDACVGFYFQEFDGVAVLQIALMIVSKWLWWMW